MAPKSTVPGAATGKYVAPSFVTNALQFPRIMPVAVGAGLTVDGALVFWFVVKVDEVGEGESVADENDKKAPAVTT
jgi:hypothetical protein